MEKIKELKELLKNLEKNIDNLREVAETDEVDYLAFECKQDLIKVNLALLKMNSFKKMGFVVVFFRNNNNEKYRFFIETTRSHSNKLLASVQDFKMLVFHNMSDIMPKLNLLNSKINLKNENKLKIYDK